MSNKTQKTVDPKEENPETLDQKTDIEGNPTDNPETPIDESKGEDPGEEEFLAEFGLGEDDEDADDSEATLEADKALKDKVADGKIPGLKPQDASYLQSSMVPHPLSGKPVYATAEAAMLAETYKDK